MRRRRHGIWVVKVGREGHCPHCGANDWKSLGPNVFRAVGRWLVSGRPIGWRERVCRNCGLEGGSSSYLVYGNGDRWWDVPLRLFEVVRHRRSMEPVPATYLGVAVGGCLVGLTARRFLGWRWWTIPAASVAGTWLFFLSSALWRPRGNASLTTEMISVVAPIGRDTVAAEGDVAIRRMRDDDDDYRRMVRWRNRPHVRKWWDPDKPPLDLEAAQEEYRPDTLPRAASTACFIERDGGAVGFIQFYRWSSYADEAREVGIPFDEGTWGVDIFIGEESETGRGLGPRALDLLCRHLHSTHGASAVALTVDLDNEVAIRSYHKAGFEQIKQVVDTDTRGGERVRSWLMVRRL